MSVSMATISPGVKAAKRQLRPELHPGCDQDQVNVTFAQLLCCNYDVLFWQDPVPNNIVSGFERGAKIEHRHIRGEEERRTRAGHHHCCSLSTVVDTDLRADDQWSSGTWQKSVYKTCSFNLQANAGIYYTVYRELWKREGYFPFRTNQNIHYLNSSSL